MKIEVKYASIGELIDPKVAFFEHGLYKCLHEYSRHKDPAAKGYLWVYPKPATDIQDLRPDYTVRMIIEVEGNRGILSTANLDHWLKDEGIQIVRCLGYKISFTE